MCHSEILLLSSLSKDSNFIQNYLIKIQDELSELLKDPYALERFTWTILVLKSDIEIHLENAHLSKFLSWKSSTSCAPAYFQDCLHSWPSNRLNPSRRKHLFVFFDGEVDVLNSNLPLFLEKHLHTHKVIVIQTINTSILRLENYADVIVSVDTRNASSAMELAQWLHRMLFLERDFGAEAFIGDELDSGACRIPTQGDAIKVIKGTIYP